MFDKNTVVRAVIKGSHSIPFRITVSMMRPLLCGAYLTCVGKVAPPIPTIPFSARSCLISSGGSTRPLSRGVIVGSERVLAVIFDDHTGRDGAVGKKASFAANDHAADTGMDIAADCSLGFGDLLSKIYIFARLYQWFGRSSDMHRERQHDFLGCGVSL